MRRKRWRVIAIVAVVAYLLLKMWCGADEESSAFKAELIENRPWIDHAPTSLKESARVFVLTDREIGAVLEGSAYRRTTDAIRWAQKGGDLEWLYLQDEKTITFTRLKVARCNDAPKPFDLCLSMHRDGKELKFYSRHDWEIGSMPDDAPAMLKSLPDPTPQN